MDLSNVKLLLTGGVNRAFARFLGHGHGSKVSELASLDWGKKKLTSLLTYKPPKKVAANFLPSSYFTSSTLVGDKLYLCANTQVLIYRYPSMEALGVIDHRYFNDLHHATLIDDTVYVASTGIDAVLGFDNQADLIYAENTLGEPLWSRRDESLDYRKVASTKPHHSHPNFVFSIDGDIWATRFEQKDAVNLSNKSDRIAIDIERPHDGIVSGDHVTFTTVNGCLVIANKHTKRVENVYDLNEIDERGMPLGWCRGVCLIDKYAFVGFTALRPTKMEKNIDWVRSMTGNKDVAQKPLPARIALYDLERRCLMEEFVFPETHLSIVFSILQG